MGTRGRALAAGIIMTGLVAAGLGAAAPRAHAATTVAAGNTAAGNTRAATVTRDAVTAQIAGAPQKVKAPYADLTDAGTGADLWNRSADTQVPMGSITKVMTAYVVLQEGNLDRLITVPSGIIAYDKKYDGSTAGLKPGEKLTARQLLYAMLIPSGCDAAYTLAAAYGPGLPGFIVKMNLAAAQLGLAHTFFTDFSGLPDPTETSTYSTAHDLVALGRIAMARPLFASISGLSSYSVPARNGLHPAFHWKTTNPLLGSYPGAVGIKTGNTQAAGDCLLFEARRGGRALIGVVLDDPSFDVAASDAKQMMNWGWAN